MTLWTVPLACHYLKFIRVPWVSWTLQECHLKSNLWWHVVHALWNTHPAYRIANGGVCSTASLKIVTPRLFSSLDSTWSTQLYQIDRAKFGILKCSSPILCWLILQMSHKIFCVYSRGPWQIAVSFCKTTLHYTLITRTIMQNRIKTCARSVLPGHNAKCMWKRKWCCKEKFETWGFWKKHAKKTLLYLLLDTTVSKQCHIFVWIWYTPI